MAYLTLRRAKICLGKRGLLCLQNEKNKQLIKERSISFEEIIAGIEEGAVLDVLPHPNPAKYPKQKMYVLNMNNYVYVVPFIRKDENTVFLKTIFPHRKLAKQYLRGKKDEKEEP
ncbi:MAG: hypothetical protein K0R24_316 [Gammaproteobacteria bacterium]|jgi:hypothetical protein|nr:hypothetical protein [Gammaproteobacteria bacterium]MCE3237335.1 hypothetical protein [Gammaproteobacteria bacterium]